MVGIAQTIISLRSQYLKQLDFTKPSEINNGNCGEFANDVADQIPGAYAIWGDDLCPILWSYKVIRLPDWFTNFAPGHCFIMYDGRFYDSECPDGCDFPDELPFYQRDIEQFFTADFSSGKMG